MDIKQKILADIRVKLTEEFDRNFQRKAFFDRPWKPRKYHNRKGTLLSVSGALRRSIHSTQGTDYIVFYSNVRYASVHNNGWSGMRKSHVRVIRRKGKTIRQNVRSRQVSFPERRFVGWHPKLEESTKSIVKRHFEKAARDLANKF